VLLKTSQLLDRGPYAERKEHCHSIVHFKVSSWGSSVSIDWTTGVPSPEVAKDFSSNLCVQTSAEAEPGLLSAGYRGSFSRGKALPESDADHTPA
jgi:hypothetical protein